MKKALIACVVLLSIAASAQAKHPSPRPSAAPALEGKVRKVWEDFTKKDKASLAAMLDDNFREVEEGASGFGDKKAEIAMVDEFEITKYTLKDFHVTSLGPNSALVTYLAHYEGKAGNEAVNANSAFGEIWIRVGNDWKDVYAQETALK
jgi:hypothetical protein